ncbi:MAG: hypothetical protein AVDCRST_MAG73-3015, partial [uncultured Thermomicrobiales bacterium]
ESVTGELAAGERDRRVWCRADRSGGATVATLRGPPARGRRPGLLPRRLV